MQAWLSPLSIAFPQFSNFRVSIQYSMPAFWPLVSSSFHSCTSSTRHTTLKVLPESASLTVARYYHSKLLLSGALINIPLIVHCCLIGRSCCIIRRWFVLEAWREAYRRRSILGLGQQVARHRKQYVNEIILPYVPRC